MQKRRMLKVDSEELDYFGSNNQEVIFRDIEWILISVEVFFFELINVITSEREYFAEKS